MSSKIEFVEYVAEQCRSAGEITFKKMFGEYGLYCNEKIFSLICDDELFVKITNEVKALYPELPEKPPYDGAKNYFLVENVDDREFLTELVMATYNALPEPKPKTPKAKKPNVK
ncbi:MAG: TfoX/Sxy family protein [Oscillospiraceae bacterium]|nr:TfoX/Sxy family protein [Oscillospiraceae bacterium]